MLDTVAFKGEEVCLHDRHSDIGLGLHVTLQHTFKHALPGL
jgi:hypothetical protein